VVGNIETGKAELPCTTIYNLSTTGLGFRCWQAQGSALSLSIVTTGLTVLPFAASAPSVTVMVTALPTS